MLAVEESERIRSSLLKNLHKALDTLLPEQRELITEIYFIGVTQREICYGKTNGVMLRHIYMFNE